MTGGNVLCSSACKSVCLFAGTARLLWTVHLSFQEGFDEVLYPPLQHMSAFPLQCSFAATHAGSLHGCHLQ